MLETFRRVFATSQSEEKGTLTDPHTRLARGRDELLGRGKGGQGKGGGGGVNGRAERDLRWHHCEAVMWFSGY